MIQLGEAGRVPNFYRIDPSDLLAFSLNRVTNLKWTEWRRHGTGLGLSPSPPQNVS